MPFNRPTLAEIQARVEADVASRLGLGALMRRGILLMLARVLAGASHLLHGHLDWLARAIFVDTAESLELDRHAAIYGVVRKPASLALGPVVFAGTDLTVVPSGTRVRRADGVEYETTADGTIDGAVVSIEVEAIDPGVDGNAAEGLVLELVVPIAGIDGDALVGVGGLIGGADVETDAALRFRVLQRIQNPPQGGSTADYVKWALAQPGVTRAWCLPLYFGAGTVGVTFVTDDAPAGPIPTPGEVDALQAYIDELRPVTAQVFVFAPEELLLEPVLSIVPDTPAMRAAVEASIEDLLRREAVPGQPLYLSHLREAISTTPGEIDHQVVAPAADVSTSTAQLLVLGAITWQ